MRQRHRPGLPFLRALTWTFLGTAFPPDASAAPYVLTFYGLNSAMTVQASDTVMKNKGFRFLPARTVRLSGGWITHTFAGTFLNDPAELTLSTHGARLTHLKITAVLNPTGPGGQPDATCQRWYAGVVRQYGRPADRRFRTTFFWDYTETAGDIQLTCEGDASVVLEIDV
ncbi:hypothetical protein LAJ19_14535 (plasmid) [Deinococcus taeanensis]|uniref:hypothetical protein n=1 Tax=Deinococcus taeanensis TaxID=2737050 RepID=UPI001CDC990D|nr:hypothetical protein [Deinococcus taeanensis]UBV44381.1 hypothetical protein LAJ19_14535 [Deinococcus taeanensis]